MNEEKLPVIDEGEEPAGTASVVVKKSVSEMVTLPVSILAASVFLTGGLVFLGVSFMHGTSAPAAAPSGAAAPAVAPSAAAPANLTALGDRDVVLGDPKAPITVIEYGDYQCPFCGKFFTDTQPQLEKDYIQSGKVKMVFRDLAFLGPESVVAAQAAECSKDQQKFWQYHDALYATEVADGQESNGNLTRELMIRLAGQVHLDVNAFTQCYDTKKYADTVSKITSDAQASGINATPTVFVNGTKIQGAQPYSQFQSIIDADLKGA